MRAPIALSRTAIFVASAAVSAASYLDLCDAIYGCGCVAWWKGAAQMCNIQTAGPPDCPWCSFGFWGGAIPFLGALSAQAAVAFWPARWGVWARFGLSLLALLAVASLFGLGFGLYTGYWSA